MTAQAAAHFLLLLWRLRDGEGTEEELAKIAHSCRSFISMQEDCVEGVATTAFRRASGMNVINRNKLATFVEELAPVDLAYLNQQFQCVRELELDDRGLYDLRYDIHQRNNRPFGGRFKTTFMGQLGKAPGVMVLWLRRWLYDDLKALQAKRRLTKLEKEMVEYLGKMLAIKPAELKTMATVVSSKLFLRSFKSKKEAAEAAAEEAAVEEE